MVESKLLMTETLVIRLIIVEFTCTEQMRFDKLTAEEEGGLRRRRGRGNAANERPLKVAPSFRFDRWTVTKR